MEFEKVYTFVIEKLKNELPAFITYHDVEHTINVINWAEYLAKKEKISDEDLLLLKTAALFHDTGFLFDFHAKGHEIRSAEYARKILPDYGFSNEQIDQIEGIILATTLPQQPVSHLQKIICDADLFYLGTDKYSDLTEKLLREFKREGRQISKEMWGEIQIDFFENHMFFTETAKQELETKKRQNLEIIEDKMKAVRKRIEQNNISESVKDFFMISIGVLIAGIALKGFLVPNHFFDGGMTGLSLLVHELYHVNLGIVIVLMNLPLIAIGYFTVGKKFAFKTLFAVVLLGVVLTLLPAIPMTSDKLLISIFGGVFLGIGVGLNMRTGAALDGIEVLALYTLKRTSFTITEIILGINIIIFSIAAFKFGIETALYSCLTYFAASRTIDYVVEGLQAFTGVTIISGESEQVKYHLVNEMKKGITVYKGERGFLPDSFEHSADCDIIFTVITRFELRKLKNIVYEIDPKAFVFANTIKEASGGIISRKQHH